jgi:hypothetical protein
MELRTLAQPLVRRVAGAIAVVLMAAVLAVSAYAGATGTGDLAASHETHSGVKPRAAVIGGVEPRTNIKVLAAVSCGCSGPSSSGQGNKPR